MLKFGIFNWICEKMVLDKKQNAEGKALVCTQVKSIKLLPEKFNFLYVCSAGTSFKNLFYFLCKDLPLKVILWKFDLSPTAKFFVRKSDNNCWYYCYSFLTVKTICQFHIKFSWVAKKLHNNFIIWSKILYSEYQNEQRNMLIAYKAI